MKVSLNQTHLPPGINAGYYRLQNGAYMIDADLKDQIDAQNRPPGVDELEQTLAEVLFYSNVALDEAQKTQALSLINDAQSIADLKSRIETLEGGVS
ncbi:hypothetical protein D3C81_1812870 [compost metagenome]